MSETHVVQVGAERYSSDTAEIRWHVTTDNRIWAVTTWQQPHAATGKVSWSYVVPALGADGTVLGFATCEEALQAAITRIEERRQGSLKRTFLRLIRPITGNLPGKPAGEDGFQANETTSSPPDAVVDTEGDTQHSTT